MGGDQNWKEIQDAIDRVHSAGLKACVYSGRKNTLIARDFLENLGLDYYKIGEYDKKLGGLSCATTNQRFFSRTGLDYEDITHVFWRTHNAH